MARAKGSTTVKKTNTKSTETLEELMEAKTEELNKKADIVDKDKQLREERRRKRTLFTDDLEVVVFCNIGNSEFIYDCPATNERYIMTYGDMEVITFKQLKAMKSRYKSILENYDIVPIDVYSDDLTIDDIIKELRMENYYSKEMLHENMIDYILLNMEFNSFRLYIEGMLGENNQKAFVRRVLDRAVQLATEGEFNDSSKRAYLEKIFDKPDLFKEIMDIVR